MLIFYPPVDAIQEFKVQTSAAPAAYGGGPSIINVTLRSGTNDLHGAVYEFVRNSDFDAKNFFDSPANPIPRFHMNEFGANFGGPVVIPHLFNGKDKLFFFADYEGKRVSQAQTYISTVPITAFHTGDFSALLPKTVLHEPGTSNPLPNNQVPLSEIDPTSANLMALIPDAEHRRRGPGQQFSLQRRAGEQHRSGRCRVDYRTTNSSVFGRFSRENPATTNPGYLPTLPLGTARVIQV